MIPNDRIVALLLSATTVIGLMLATIVILEALSDVSLDDEPVRLIVAAACGYVGAITGYLIGARSLTSKIDEHTDDTGGTRAD